jgi:long-chain fatty acid transport protein
MMRKLSTKILILIAIAVFPASAWAQMDNLANMSAKWIGSNTRNAALDGGDIVNYNPAGLALVKDGLYISLNNQTLFRKPQHSFNLGYGEQKYEQDGPDYFLPAGYVAFKHGRWAVSSGTYITGGGASADYPDGSVNMYLMGIVNMAIINATYGTGYTNFNQSLKASSYYLAVPLNVSFSINDKLAVSLGGRYISANNHTEAGLTFTGSTVGANDYPNTIDYKNKAHGFGGIIGIDYAVNEKLNVSVHYESIVKLEFEASDNKGSNKNFVADGTKSNRDLPAVLYTGVSYKITDKLGVAADFNYYFQKSADWGSFGDTIDKSEAAGNCYAAALGATYQICPKFQLSAGCKYIHFNYSDQELYYTQMGLYEAVKYDNFNVGLGVAYNITEKIQANLGLGRTFWKDKTINSESASGMPVNIKNKSYVVALGVDLAF